MYSPKSIHSGSAAPSRPMSMPSSTKGALTKKSVAPTYFIMLISSARTEMPMATVLLIRKILTASRITIMPRDT